MEEGRGHNTQACKGFAKKTLKSFAASRQHSQSLSSPSHIQRKREERSLSDNEAVSLPVFVLKWINTREGITLLFVRKRTWCCFVWGLCLMLSLAAFLIFLYSFCFCNFVSPMHKHPLMLAYDFLARSVRMLNVLLANCWRSDPPRFLEEFSSYLDIQSTDSEISCTEERGSLCFRCMKSTAWPYRNMKRSAQLIPGTRSLYRCLFPCVTRMSSVNQFCHGECLCQANKMVENKCKTAFTEGHSQANLDTFPQIFPVKPKGQRDIMMCCVWCRLSRGY